MTDWACRYTWLHTFLAGMGPITGPTTGPTHVLQVFENNWVQKVFHFPFFSSKTRTSGSFIFFNFKRLEPGLLPVLGSS